MTARNGTEPNASTQINRRRGIISHYKSLINNVKYSDVRIVAGDGKDTKTFNAHKPILATQSQFYAAAFDKTWARPDENGIISITHTNISPQVMEVVLEYIYTGEVDLSHDIAPKVIEAADYLTLPVLAEACCDTVNTETVASLYTTYYKLAKTTICKYLYQYFPKNWAMNEDFLKELSGECLVWTMYFRRSLTDADVWNLILNWAKANQNEQHSYGDCVFSLIQKMSENMFELSFDTVNYNQLIQPFLYTMTDCQHHAKLCNILERYREFKRLEE